MCPGNCTLRKEPSLGRHPTLANLVFISCLSPPGTTAHIVLYIYSSLFACLVAPLLPLQDTWISWKEVLCPLSNHSVLRLCIYCGCRTWPFHLKINISTFTVTCRYLNSVSDFSISFFYLLTKVRFLLQAKTIEKSGWPLNNRVWPVWFHLDVEVFCRYNKVL